MSTTGSLYHPRTLLTMKLALAFAILRNKPKCMSGKEYTQKLALQFSDMQKDWKTKAGNLESELLKVKQHLAQLSIDQHFGTASCDNIQSSGYCSNMTSGGCSGQRPQEGLPVVGRWDIIQEGEEAVMSSHLNPSSTEMYEVVRELESNLRFLQKFARYQLLTEERVSADIQDSVPQAVATLTVVKAIESVAILLEEMGKFPSIVVVDSVKNLAGFTVAILDKSLTGSDLQALQDSCQHLVKSVVDCLSRNPFACSLASTEGMDYLQILCSLTKSRHLQEIVLLPLIELIQKCIKNLEEAETDVATFDPGLVWLVGEVTSLLSDILRDLQHISEAVQESLLSLKEDVCKLVSSFPLFTFLFWKVEKCMLNFNGPSVVR